MTGDSELEAIRWQVRPYEKEPMKRVVIFMFALIALIFGTFVYRQPLLGVLGFAIILGATMEYWLGSSYRVDAEGATSRTGLSVTSIRWSDVKRIVIGEREVKLSPLEEGTSRMDAFRGVQLKVDDAVRARVIEAVRDFGGSHARILE